MAGYLYLARVRHTDVIKLGYSGLPIERINSIRSQHRVDAHVVGMVPSSWEEERALHCKLDAFRRFDFGGKEFYSEQVLSVDGVPHALRCPLSPWAYDPPDALHAASAEWRRPSRTYYDTAEQFLGAPDPRAHFSIVTAPKAKRRGM